MKIFISRNRVGSLIFKNNLRHFAKRQSAFDRAGGQEPQNSSEKIPDLFTKEQIEESRKNIMEKMKKI